MSNMSYNSYVTDFGRNFEILLQVVYTWVWTRKDTAIAIFTPKGDNLCPLNRSVGENTADRRGALYWWSWRQRIPWRSFSLYIINMKSSELNFILYHRKNYITLCEYVVSFLLIINFWNKFELYYINCHKFWKIQTNYECIYLLNGAFQLLL